jgi:hypothetical protein
MNDTYTLLQNLINATEARKAATKLFDSTEKQARVAEIQNRDAYEIACILRTPYPDEVQAAYDARNAAADATPDAYRLEAAAYAAAKAYVEGRELAAFAAAFAPTGELFGDEA